jgi:cytochrome o ubiquinol oxidase subunit 2
MANAIEKVVKKHKTKPGATAGHHTGSGKTVRFVVLGIILLVLVIRELLRGTDVELFNPKGFVAHEQLNLMLLIGGILLAIAIPSLFLFYFFAWKYRETNPKAVHDPHPRHGKYLVLTMWAIPTVFMIVLATIMWSATHRLVPQKALAGNGNPLVVQVVAMRWKWLFLYPEQQIATVNFIQIPTGRPVQFELTADDAPMSSFWIPHLGGQLYAMTGHINRLNLVADTEGDYRGSSAEINGAGFAGMKFTARASSQEDFDQWTQEVRASSGVLDGPGYNKLLQPSENNQAAAYTMADQDLYDTVLMKYAMNGHGLHNSNSSNNLNDTTGSADSHSGMDTMNNSMENHAGQE